MHTANSRKANSSLGVRFSSSYPPLLPRGYPSRERADPRRCFLCPALSRACTVRDRRIMQSRGLAIAQGWSLDLQHYACLRIWHSSPPPAPACVRKLFPCGYNSGMRMREGDETGPSPFPASEPGEDYVITGQSRSRSRDIIRALPWRIRALALASPGSPSPPLPSVPRPLPRRCEFTPPLSRHHIIVYVCRACAH